MVYRVKLLLGTAILVLIVLPSLAGAETTEQFRSHWFGALARATSLLERVAQSMEIAQEMILAQFEAQFNGMMALIDGDFSKIAILNRRHRKKCEAVMADSGLDNLIAEKFFQRLSR